MADRMTLEDILAKAKTHPIKRMTVRHDIAEAIMRDAIKVASSTFEPGRMPLGASLFDLTVDDDVPPGMAVVEWGAPYPTMSEIARAVDAVASLMKGRT